MTKSMTGVIAALLVTAAWAWAFPAAAQDQDAEQSGPRILQLDTDAVPDRGDDVKVFRGSAVHPEPVARLPSSKAAPQGGVETAGGETLWVVDRKASVVTGCYLQVTISVTVPQEIRCVSRRLR